MIFSLILNFIILNVSFQNHIQLDYIRYAAPQETQAYVLKVNNIKDDVFEDKIEKCVGHTTIAIKSIEDAIIGKTPNQTIYDLVIVIKPTFEAFDKIVEITHSVYDLKNSKEFIIFNDDELSLIIPDMVLQTCMHGTFL